jgi:hypothetical protein
MYYDGGSDVFSLDTYQAGNLTKKALSIPLNGNIGIGITYPTSNLEVSSSNNTETSISNNNYVPGQTNSLSFKFRDATNNNYTRYGQWQASAPGGNIIDMNYNLFDGATGTLLTPFTIKGGNGNIGINNINPAYDLDVRGTSRFYDTTNPSRYLIHLGSTGVGTYRSGYISGDGTNMSILNQQGGSLTLGTNNGGGRAVLSSAGDLSVSTSVTVPTVSATTKLNFPGGKWSAAQDASGRLCFAVSGANVACLDTTGNIVKP